MMIFLLLIPFLAFAEFRQENFTEDGASLKKESFHSYADVCKALGHKADSTKMLSLTTLDCSGKVVVVGEFCEKEMGSNPFYLRGFINHTKAMVTCWAGNKVTVRYECATINNKSICNTRDSKKSCEIIQQEKAKNLTVLKHEFKKSFLGYTEVHCYFEKTPVEEIDHGL